MFLETVARIFYLIIIGHDKNVSRRHSTRREEGHYPLLQCGHTERPPRHNSKSTNGLPIIIWYKTTATEQELEMGSIISGF